MRLINVETYDLVEFETDVSGYAILSHTWGDEEVTFQDMHRGLDFARRKKGFTKIQGTCSRAKADGFSYAWVDTCCIDKSSSAELSEAINSMYRWYQKAEICYAFISDVHMDGIPWESQFRDSRWFTRGWTLQELLAPAELIFYSGDWVRIGSKAELSKLISSITQIDENALEGTRLDSFSIAHRLSWASRRTTKRLEDMAYCLLGIFDVNMALLYGEGERAFTRLQEEIIKTSDDHSIFAWFTKGADPNAERGLLATSPKEFEYSGGIVPIMEPTTSSIPFTMTNKGLRIALNVSLPSSHNGTYRAVINCSRMDRPELLFRISLKQLTAIGDQYCRVDTHMLVPHNMIDPGYHMETLYAPQRIPNNLLWAALNEGDFDYRLFISAVYPLQIEEILYPDTESTYKPNMHTMPLEIKISKKTDNWGAIKVSGTEHFAYDYSFSVLYRWVQRYGVVIRLCPSFSMKDGVIDVDLNAPSLLQVEVKGHGWKKRLISARSTQGIKQGWGMHMVHLDVIET